MNVNSIKINNVLLDGEVDLDKELPTAIEGLEVVEGLVESVTEHEAEIGGLIDNENLFGAKNLFDFEGWLKINNVVYTKSGNSYTFTPPTTSNNPLYNNPFIFSDTDKPIILTSTVTPTEGSTATNISFEIANTSNAWSDRNQNITYTGSKIRMNWTTVGEVTVTEPMIRLASDTSSTYAPYSKSNNQLTRDTTMLSNNKELLGTKNILPLKLATLKALNTTGTWVDNVYSLTGIDFTVNTDIIGNITDINVNGTATTQTEFKLVQLYKYTQNTILNGVPAIDTAGLRIVYYNASDVYQTEVTINNNAQHTMNTQFAKVSLNIKVNNEAEVTNQKFYPMLRLASDTDKTYRPYSMSTTELTQKIIDLEARVTALEG